MPVGRRAFLALVALVGFEDAAEVRLRCGEESSRESTDSLQPARGAFGACCAVACRACGSWASNDDLSLLSPAPTFIAEHGWPVRIHSTNVDLASITKISKLLRIKVKAPCLNRFTTSLVILQLPMQDIDIPYTAPTMLEDPALVFTALNM